MLNYCPTPGEEYIRVSAEFARDVYKLKWYDSSIVFHPTYRESDRTVVIPVRSLPLSSADRAQPCEG